MGATLKTGYGRIVARRVENRTVLAEAHARSPLRFVQADFRTTGAAVCLVTFGGGLVDGDAIDTLTQSDLLVINKTDLAAHVGARLDVMASDATRMAPRRPLRPRALQRRRRRRCHHRPRPRRPPRSARGLVEG